MTNFTSSTDEMFDPERVKKHIGTEIKYRKRLENLAVCEKYFIEKCKEVEIDYAHDCTAEETSYFKTFNYTTYAGLFIMHPLSFDLQLFQMYDAKADCFKGLGHLDWVHNNIKNNQAGKYTLGDGNEMPTTITNHIDAVLVMPGSNKFTNTSKIKIERLVKLHGSNLIIKPHPITKNEVLGELFNIKGNAQMAGRTEDLYSLINSANIVYTTHISETALTSLLMEKKILPIDKYSKRLKGSFSHINHFLFSEKNPLEAIESIFASPKSGVVHPEIDTDWKQKIDAYIEYSIGQRSIQKGYYYE